MKTTTNIIATIMSLIATLAMVSCSTEGDVLDEMNNGKNPVNTEISAAIFCTINNITTKSSDETQDASGDTNEEVQSLIFFLMKGDQVLTCKENKDAILYTKQQEGMTVIAVANASSASRNILVNAVNRNEIYSQILVAGDLEKLIKIGESGKIESFEKINDKTVKASADIVVSQVAARIDLSKLTVKVKASESKDVKLTSVELMNQNVNGKLDRTFSGLIKGGVNAVYGTETILKDNVLNENICHFYTFSNEDKENKTALVLHFEVDGVKSTRSFDIKHPGIGEVVKSGYLYRLNITVNVYGENVEPEVTFEVADWKTSQMSSDMTEGK